MKAFRTLSALAAAAALAVALSSAADAGDRRVARGARANADGGVTAHSIRRGSAEDVRAVRRSRLRTDGEGGGRLRSGGCVEGEAGAACRARRASWEADGSVERQSGARWRTESGSGTTTSSLVRNADGTYAGERATTAAGSGGAYESVRTIDSEAGYARSATASGENGSVSIESHYQRGVGGARTVTCFDASGAVVPCPDR